MNEQLKLNNFIAEVFGFLESSNLTPETNFKDLNNWNSLNALIIVFNLKNSFGVDLNIEEFNTVDTIYSLYLLAQKKHGKL